MYENQRSDFAAPLASFLLIGIVAMLVAFTVLATKFNSVNVGSLYSTLTTVIGPIGFVIAGFALYKAYLVEGFSCAAASIFATSSIPGVAGGECLFAIALLVIFAVPAVMSYLQGYLDLTIINGLLGISALIFGAFKGSEYIVGLFLIAAAAVTFYVAVVEWIDVQEFIDAYEEALYGDDDEDCCCDDECTCGCQDEESETQEPEAEESSETPKE